MTSSIVTPSELAAEMRQFILDQAQGRTQATVDNYAQVADDLSAFLANVDVAPWLGNELAAHLGVQRDQLRVDAFLTTLGLAGVIRVLPAFAVAPWLPPPGPQRRAHRVAVRHLATFLRLRAVQEGCFHRDDLKPTIKALGRAYALDHPPVRRSDLITCTVTVDLLDRLVDALLEQVSRGHYETLDEAVAARLNPVERTYWEEPDQDLPYGW